MARAINTILTHMVYANKLWTGTWWRMARGGRSRCSRTHSHTRSTVQIIIPCAKTNKSDRVCGVESGFQLVRRRSSCIFTQNVCSYYLWVLVNERPDHEPSYRACVCPSVGESSLSRQLTRHKWRSVTYANGLTWYVHTRIIMKFSAGWLLHIEW